MYRTITAFGLIGLLGGCGAAETSADRPSQAAASATARAHTCASIHACQTKCNEAIGSACTQLAVEYEKVRTPANLSRARTSYARACDLENGAGCLGAATYEIDDSRANVLYARACKLGEKAGCQAARAPRTDTAQRLDRACTAGVFRACKVRGTLIVSGALIIKSGADRAKYLELACMTREPSSCKRLGEMYLKGDGVRRDEALATDAFSRACRYGDPSTCKQLGVALMARGASSGSAVRFASVKAKVYERGCHNGNVQCCLDYGRQLQLGDGISRDREKAAEVFETVCSRGSGQGCVLAADMYRQGWGVSFNPDKAAALYARACENDQPAACRKLSELVRKGKGVDKSAARADRLLKRACNLGSASACHESRDRRRKAKNNPATN